MKPAGMELLKWMPAAETPSIILASCVIATGTRYRPTRAVDRASREGWRRGRHAHCSRRDPNVLKRIGAVALEGCSENENGNDSFGQLEPGQET